jgi:hypothetical protein
VLIDHQGGLGTGNLTGHGGTEPAETQILSSWLREAIIFYGSATAFTACLPGSEVLLQKQADVPGRDIGTPMNSADVGTRVLGGAKKSPKMAMTGSAARAWS